MASSSVQAPASAEKSEAAEAPKFTFLGDDVRSVTIPLKHPFSFGGVEYRELTAQRLRGKSILRLKKLANAGETRMEELIYALICDVPIEVIESLDGDDFVEVASKTVDFLPLF